MLALTGQAPCNTWTTGVESLGPAVHPPSPSKIKSNEPWLKGTFRTDKGRIITGEELCQSLERMTNAYVDKYMNAAPNGTPYMASGITLNHKTLTPDDVDAMISR